MQVPQGTIAQTAAGAEGSSGVMQAGARCCGWLRGIRAAARTTWLLWTRPGFKLRMKSGSASWQVRC